jgi:hypothetical protein
MIVIDQIILSDDIAENHFVCDLTACKGACCEEGDSGAPLEQQECELLDAQFQAIKPYISEEGALVIQSQGTHILDQEGDWSTPLMQNGACAYSIRINGVLQCGIEKAWQQGKSSLQKPISCHLYPIRLNRYDTFEAVNYHRWSICGPACTLGSRLQVPLYIFLKGALIRRFGAEWYEKLESEIGKRNQTEKLSESK